MLSLGEPDEHCLQLVADHLETCVECQQTLNTMAAEPDLWKLASKLNSDPLISMQGSTSRTDSLPIQTAPVAESGVEELSSKYSVELLLDAPSHPEMMGRIGGYDIEREVGRGGMGVVFKAFDTELNRPLAIKVLSPRLAENGTARQRFAREARAAAAVLHPNVVAIYGVNSSHDMPYLVMPYVAGPSLQKLVDQHGPLEAKEIVRMAMQVAAGLSAAHSQGLVHRDIKPANILVEADVSRVLVTDFGLARAIGDASMTQSGHFVGTPNYMSPEHALGKQVDARSDLFSLGSVMYFMATGHMPFRAETPLCVLNRISSDEPTPMRQLNNDISKTLSDITVKLLQKNPCDRFQSAGELHEVLEKYLAYLHQPDVSKPPTITSTETSKSLFSTKSGALLGVALIAALLGAFGSGWLQLPSLQQSVSPQGPPAAEESVRQAKEAARHAEAAGRTSAESARHSAAGQQIQRELGGDEGDASEISVPVPVAPPSAPAPPEPTSESKSVSKSATFGWLAWLTGASATSQ